MFGLGMPEILLILAIALIVIGPKKLPELAKTLGKAMGEFKKSAQEFKKSIDVETTVTDIADNDITAETVAKSFAEAKEKAKNTKFTNVQEESDDMKTKDEKEQDKDKNNKSDKGLKQDKEQEQNKEQESNKEQKQDTKDSEDLNKSNEKQKINNI